MNKPVAFFGPLSKVGDRAFAVRTIDVDTLRTMDREFGFVPDYNSTYGHFEVIEEVSDEIPRRKQRTQI